MIHFVPGAKANPHCPNCARGAYSINSRQVGIPGSYESERAARLAFQLPNVTLEAMQNAANEANGGTCGILTYDEIRAAVAERRRSR